MTILWLMVVLLALTGRRRAAAAVACVPLALDLPVVLALVMERADVWSRVMPMFLVTAGGGPAVLASLAVCSLAFSAGPRRGLAITGGRRACMMIAGLSVVFGWSSVVILLSPSVYFSGFTFRVLNVLALAVAIALTRVRGTSGGRVAALMATGLLPGLASNFSFAGPLTVDIVSALSTLLLTVLVWPLAITSWKGRPRQTHQARSAM